MIDLHCHTNASDGQRTPEELVAKAVERELSAIAVTDHDTIAEFRKRNLQELAGLFVQVLQLCQKAGLIKLGHVSLDGTKVKANASKHKAMSYGRLKSKEKALCEEIETLVARANACDEEEDAEYKERTGYELPEDIKFKQQRLETIKRAKEALEAR